MSGARWWVRILRRLGIAVLVFAAFIAYLAWRDYRSAATELDKYAIGDCLVLAQDGIGVKDAAAECDTDPSYLVAGRIGGDDTCPNEHYTAFEVTAGGSSGGKLCLVENLVPGHCYETEMISKVTKLVDCSRGSMFTPMYRVVTRHDTGDAACPDGQTVIAYPEPGPGRTYCMA